MAAGTYDIVIDQGADFAIEIAITDDNGVVALATHYSKGTASSISNFFY